MPPSPRVPLRTAADALVRRAFLRELAAVVTLVVAFHAGRIAVAAALDPYFLDSDTGLLLVRNALDLVWAAGLVSSYAAWRGYALPVGIPARRDGRLATAVVATAALATLPFLSLALRMDVGVGHVTTALADPVGVFTARTLLRIALFVPATALLAHGLIQGAFRRALDGDGEAVAATALLGGYLAAPTAAAYGTFGNGPWLSLWGVRAAAAALFVLALGVAVVAAERGDGRARAIAWLPVLVALAVVAVVLVPAVRFPGGAVVMATRTAVVGVAAAAYAENDSLAAPALVYAAFAAVSSVLHAASLAAAFG